VKQAGLGAEISTGDGWSYGFTPFAKRRRLVTWLLAAGLLTGLGLLWLAAAMLIQPQASGALVYVAAHLLTAVSWLVGAVIVLIGAMLLGQAWRDRRAAPAS